MKPTPAKPPEPWTVEMLGLASAVEFRHPEGRRLLWVDGEWWSGTGQAMRKVAAPAPARTMAEARIAGCGWLRRLEEWQDR